MYNAISYCFPLCGIDKSCYPKIGRWVATTKPSLRINQRLETALLVLDHHRQRYKTGERESLDPSVLGFQRRYFRCVQIAFRIDGQVVQRTELSRSRAPRSKSIEEL